VGVNLMSGKATTQILFNDKQPDYEVDDAAGRLFNMRKGVLSAYAITEPAPEVANEEKEK
jgi:hypothetical protein